VAKLICEICGYITEVPGAENLTMSEMPLHCGQPYAIIEEENNK